MRLVFSNMSDEIIALGKKCQHACWDKENILSVPLNQRVTIDANCIEISGDRDVLWGNEYAPLMKKLVSEKHKPLTYESKNKNIRWYETMRDYLCIRATDKEILDELKKNPLSKDIYLPALKLANKTMGIEIGTKEYKKACAEGIQPSSEAYSARAILLKYYGKI